MNIVEFFVLKNISSMFVLINNQLRLTATLKAKYERTHQGRRTDNACDMAV